MAKKPTYQIPFNEQGVMQDYVGYGPYDWIVWKDNFEFDATLLFDGYGRGRSSAVIMLIDDKTKIRYQMFLSTFDDLMRSKQHKIEQNNGVISFTGKFTFCKKGTNYAMKPVINK